MRDAPLQQARAALEQLARDGGSRDARSRCFATLVPALRELGADRSLTKQVCKLVEAGNPERAQKLLAATYWGDVEPPGSGRMAAALVLLGLTVAAWAGWWWFAYQQDAALGVRDDGFSPLHHGLVLGPLAGSVATMYAIGHTYPAIAGALRFDFSFCVSPLAPLVTPLVTLHVLLGRFGGGSTGSHEDGSYQHHASVKLSSVGARALAAVLLVVTGVGASFGYHFAARAAGVDIVQTMRDDLGL